MNINTMAAISVGFVFGILAGMIILVLVATALGDSDEDGPPDSGGGDGPRFI